jgi:2-oxoglutarate dehydrogenase E1 component
MNRTMTAAPEAALATSERDLVFDAFRRWGYLQADLDPLGFLKPQPHPELEIDGPLAAQARKFYCGTVGVEFMHIPDPARRRWIQERIEGNVTEPATTLDRRTILERLVRAEVFEQVLQARYLGTKRFSLEGNCSLIPLLDEIIEGGAEHGAEQVVVGMSHRGRLNVMVHTVRRAIADVVAGFEDVDPRSVLGSGDVKYHMGATGTYETRTGRGVAIHLVSNPSHLEAVDPVMLGRVRAKQTRLGSEGKIIAIMLHGDAAFAGQGIAAEALNLVALHGYRVGGTIHVIVNNLIGFTTRPDELHSSRFASDVAKRLPIPIFHVNAEDPDTVVRVARWALEYRYAFSSDVLIDLIGFRRHGHSEVDDPTITQPMLYRKIEQHPPLWQLYSKAINADASGIAQQARAEFEEAQKKAQAMDKKPVLRKLPTYWDTYKGGLYDPSYEVDTGLPAEELAALGDAIASAPPDFHVHPKMVKLLDQRRKMARGQMPVDYGMAEALAFGSLLKQHVPVRLSGQDSQRGTFNQRHAVLFDVENESVYVPLRHVARDQGRFEIYNSMLSEAAVLGFEYGFSRDYPEALVLWEAQFGDFANGAQVIIDQFITAGEDKWGLLSGLVLLLPHGMEGQGPEHSSARPERYLQLAAKDNIQVCQPSTAAQYFHMLRRQALRSWRKPLFVLTPKSMLRHPDAASRIEEFTRARLLSVVPENEIQNASRMLVCSGKIGHELRRERTRRKDTNTAIVFLDQLYPFPEKELTTELERHPNVREVVWVQEEPANMGAWWYCRPRLERVAHDIPVRSVKRSASASPATGSAKAHEVEQKTLLSLAFASS